MLKFLVRLDGKENTPAAKEVSPPVKKAKEREAEVASAVKRKPTEQRAIAPTSEPKSKRLKEKHARRRKEERWETVGVDDDDDEGSGEEDVNDFIASENEESEESAAESEGEGEESGEEASGEEAEAEASEESEEEESEEEERGGGGELFTCRASIE